MKKTFFLIAIAASSFGAYAQSTGEIDGTITDTSGKGILNVHIDILDASGARTGRSTMTHTDGHYTMSGLQPGKYDMQYSDSGFATCIVKGVAVGADAGTAVNLYLNHSSQKEIEILQYVKPLINDQDTRLEQHVAQADINNQNVNDVAAQQAGATQKDAGSRISVDGSQQYQVQYMINGIPLMNNSPAGGATGKP